MVYEPLHKESMGIYQIRGKIRTQQERRRVFAKIADFMKSNPIYGTRSIGARCVLLNIYNGTIISCIFDEYIHANFNERSGLFLNNWMVFLDPESQYMANEDYARMSFRKFIAEVLFKMNYGDKKNLTRGSLPIKFLVYLAANTRKISPNSSASKILTMIARLMLNKEEVNRGQTSISALKLLDPKKMDDYDQKIVTSQPLPPSLANILDYGTTCFAIGLPEHDSSINIPNSVFDTIPKDDYITCEPIQGKAYKFGGEFMSKNTKDRVQGTRSHLGIEYPTDDSEYEIFDPVPKTQEVLESGTNSSSEILFMLLLESHQVIFYSIQGIVMVLQEKFLQVIPQLVLQYRED